MATFRGSCSCARSRLRSRDPFDQFRTAIAQVAEKRLGRCISCKVIVKAPGLRGFAETSLSCVSTRPGSKLCNRFLQEVRQPEAPPIQRATASL
jgi:hypothetical protein